MTRVNTASYTTLHLPQKTQNAAKLSPVQMYPPDPAASDGICIAVSMTRVNTACDLDEEEFIEVEAVCLEA